MRATRRVIGAIIVMVKTSVFAFSRSRLFLTRITSSYTPVVRIGPLSRTARPLAHTNTKISSISTNNYSTKMGDLLELQNALADLHL